jgi:hypothetical protein
MMNKLLIERIRKVYTTRLLEALKEVDLVDGEGNILISKDLKVFHKKSGYEYTVDDVVNTGDGIKVILREPEDPRFLPPASTDILDEMSADLLNNPDISIDAGLEDDPEEVLFVVDEETFEKEYEVK